MCGGQTLLLSVGSPLPPVVLGIELRASGFSNKNSYSLGHFADLCSLILLSAKLLWSQAPSTVTTFRTHPFLVLCISLRPLTLNL